MPRPPERADFHSQGLRCAADLWLPEGVDNPPIVVMGHGFAALRTFGIPAYAERFADAGLAVLAFDYRTFGDSEGYPRQVVDHRRHLEDWQAAVAHARGLPDVDGTRVALWGSSYGGGHVLTTAAQDHGITAVVAQVPFVDGLATLRHLPPATLARLTAHGLRDAARLLTGQRPHTVPVVARPDELGAMNTPGAYEGYMAIVDPASRWENEVPARAALTLPLYRPVRVADRIRCPVLVLYGAEDRLIPADAVERTIARIPHVEPHREPHGHWEVYAGEAFERAVATETDFLVRHLGPSSRPS